MDKQIITDLYKKYGVDKVPRAVPKTVLNTGTLDNQLNTGTLFNKMQNTARWTNSSVTLRK